MIVDMGIPDNYEGMEKWYGVSGMG